MHLKRYVLVSILSLMYASGTFAQEDTTFINNYKRFRSLVDPLPTYSVYMVPFQSSKKYAISESKEYLREAYHFLRKKTINLKRPDFIIGVLVDDLDIDHPVHTYESLNKDFASHKVAIKYRASFNILVVTKSGESLQFPLVTKKEFSTGGTLETLYESYNASPTPGERAMPINSTNNQVYPDIENFKYEFLRLLEKYKNYYIDRVD